MKKKVKPNIRMGRITDNNYISKIKDNIDWNLFAIFIESKSSRFDLSSKSDF